MNVPVEWCIIQAANICISVCIAPGSSESAASWRGCRAARLGRCRRSPRGAPRRRRRKPPSPQTAPAPAPAARAFVNVSRQMQFCCKFGKPRPWAKSRPREPVPTARICTLRVNIAIFNVGLQSQPVSGTSWGRANGNIICTGRKQAVCAVQSGIYSHCRALRGGGWQLQLRIHGALASHFRGRPNDCCMRLIYDID